MEAERFRWSAKLVCVENNADRLMRLLIEFAYDDTKPANVRLAAIKDSLNRAGLRPPTEIAIGETRPILDRFPISLTQGEPNGLR